MSLLVIDLWFEGMHFGGELQWCGTYDEDSGKSHYSRVELVLYQEGPRVSACVVCGNPDWRETERCFYCFENQEWVELEEMSSKALGRFTRALNAHLLDLEDAMYWDSEWGTQSPRLARTFIRQALYGR
jgi:hypothetical protein